MIGMKTRWFILVIFLFMGLFSTELYASIQEDLWNIEQQGQEDSIKVLTVSEGLTRITGTAIYPAFGLVVLGAVDYMGGSTHWYSSPLIFVPLLILIVLEFLKNSFGITLGPIKKFADAGFRLIDYINANLGLVMSVGFAVDSMSSSVATALQYVPNPLISTAYAAGDYTGGDSIIVTIFAAIIGAFIYFAMWLLSHTFELLIFLCPFNSIDLILKSIQKILVSTLFIMFVIFPPLAVVFCLAYLFISLLLLKFCIRYSNFGITMLYQVVFRRGKETVNIEEGIECFSNSGVEGVPSRSKGKLIKKDDTIVFEYRTLPFFPIYRTNVDLKNLYVIKGNLYANINSAENGWGTNWFILSPKYLGKEEEIIQALQCQAGEGYLAKGFKAIINYIKNDLMGGQNSDVPAPNS